MDCKPWIIHYIKKWFEVNLFMPIYIKEEEKAVSRLNRNHFVPRLVNYIELTADEKQEKLDVQLHHEGAVPGILAQFEIHVKRQQTPIDFKYVVNKSKLTFFSDNVYALNFLVKISAISKSTYDLAVFCHTLEPHSSSTCLRR